MAERTLSIVIEVDGSSEAVAQTRRMRSALDDLGGGAEGLRRVAQQSREVTQVMKEMGKNFDLRQQQRTMLGDLEDFFRRITTGARNAGDVFKNIWSEVSNYFQQLLREMAASVAARLGGGFSLGSGGGLSLGGSLGGLLGGITSFSFGAVGALIGGIAGGIASLFGKDKNKEHDAEVANQGFAALRQIKDDYERHRRDFASTIDAMNRIWQQMSSAFVRPQSQDQRQWFDIMIAQVQQIEDQRNSRRQLLAAGPVPEFQQGGLVHGWGRRVGSGRVPAWLHEGEFVMNRQAVDRLGLSLLDGLNRGTAGGGQAANTISIDPDGSRWLEQNADALEKGIAVVLRRGGAVSRALRG